MVEPGSVSKKDRILNILSLFILALVVLAVIAFLSIYRDPASPLNLFPPPTAIPPVVLPTSTATQRSLPPTWTATLDLNVPTGTQTIQPQQPDAGVTISVVSTGTPEPTVSGGYIYQLQGTPTGMASTIFKPASGCGWLGVAGNVYDLQGRAVQGLIVRLGGVYQGKYIKEQFTLTGLARSYGESGYELTIASVPEASYQSLWIQLYDQGDIPVSEKVYFDTFADCNRNLILINFKQVR